MSDIPYPPPPTPPIPQQPVVRNSPVVSPGVANAVPPAVNPDDAFNQRLMSFGAAMAQSNSPSFFAQLGAGFGAVQNADRQDRREATQNREIDVMEEYRRAQIAVQEAQLAAEQDPSSPRNQLLLAQARSSEIQARAALANAGRGDRVRVVSQQRDAEGNLYNVYDNGTVDRVGGANGPSFVDPANTPAARRYAAWETGRREFLGQVLRAQPPLGTDPGAWQIERRNMLTEYDRLNPAPPMPGSPQTAPAATPPADATPRAANPRADAFGRPLPSP